MSEEVSSPSSATTDKKSTTDNLLKVAAAWLADGSQVDDVTHDRLDQIARSNSAKLRLFENILALKKAERLQRLSEVSDKVEKKLFEKVDRVNDPEILMKLVYLLQDLTKEDASYVQRVANAGVDPAITNLLHQMETEKADNSDTVERLRKIPPQSRELLRKVADRLEARRQVG